MSKRQTKERRHRRATRTVLLLAALIGVVCLLFFTFRPAPKKPHIPKTEAEVVSSDLKTRPALPSTLKDLLALPPGELQGVDTAALNLLCAEGLLGAEHLDVQAQLDTLDSWARRVASETLRNFRRFAANPREYGGSLATYRMMMLVTVLQQDFGAHYSKARRDPQLRGEEEPFEVFFGDSRDVFLNGLLGGNRAGTCASLPVLYVAVAQRLGYPVSLASTLGHLYVRYDDGEEHLNVEATTVGFVTHPDRYYHQDWPRRVTDEEARLYGWLRPMTKAEMLGSFLTTRAHTLHSMKRFDEEADAWAHAARYLPDTPVLRNLVQRSRDYAAQQRAADRWDEMADEVMRITLPRKPEYLELADQRLRLQMFMNQSTDIAAIEAAVAQLKQEVEAAWQREALASDSPGLIRSSVSVQPAHVGRPAALELLEMAELAQPRRMKIPEHRVPSDYRFTGIPTALQERLNGLNSEDQVVAEMWAFSAEENNRRNEEHQSRIVMLPGIPLLPHVHPEWLPEKFRKEMPRDLYVRLTGPQRNERQVKMVIQNYEQLENIKLRSQANQQRPIPPLTGPPLVIELVPTQPEAK